MALNNIGERKTYLVYPSPGHLKLLILPEENNNNDNAQNDADDQLTRFYAYDIYGKNGLPKEMDKLCNQVNLLCYVLMGKNDAIFKCFIPQFFEIIACYMQCIHSLQKYRECTQRDCIGLPLYETKEHQLCNCFFRKNGVCLFQNHPVCDLCWDEQSYPSLPINQETMCLCPSVITLAQCKTCYECECEHHQSEGEYYDDYDDYYDYDEDWNLGED